MRLKKKVALITGATSGIGRYTAILFCREGARVAVVGRRIDKGRETVKMTDEAGGHAIFLKTDITKASEVKEMVQAALKAFGKIDILFNNAGVNPVQAKKPLAECPEEYWDEVMEVNMKGIFLTSKYVIPHMIKNKGGSIINTSSNQGHIASQNRCAYITSKGGVTLLTKSMAIDYASYNIRVNCICPAIVETDMAKKTLAKARKDKNLWQELIGNKIPLGRPGRPEDIAYAALFLASDESSFITGTSLMVDGGYTAQ